MERPTYEELREAALLNNRHVLSKSGKSDEQILKSARFIRWSFHKFCEIAEIVTPAEYIDERVITKVTMERIINKAMWSNDSSRKKILTIMRGWVRPIALQLTEDAGNYKSLRTLLNYHFKQSGMCVGDLAATVGMDVATLRSWLDGRQPTTRRNLEHLAALERVLDLPAKTLLAHVNGPRSVELPPQTPAEKFETLSEALAHYMRLGCYNTSQLSYAVKIQQTVMNDWIRKGTVPRSTVNIDALQNCEEVLGTPPGALMRFTDRSRRYLKASHSDYGLSRNHFSMIRSHFPDNFDLLPLEKRKEIVEWTTSRYRVPLDDDDDGGIRTPYRCQFRGVEHHAGHHEGVFFAPPQLQKEYDALIRMHAGKVAPVNIKRKKSWTPGSVSARTSSLGMFFGAVRNVAPDIPLERYSLLLATDMDLVRKAVEYIISRRGRATPSMVLMLVTLQRVFSTGDGFVMQHRDIFLNAYNSLPADDEFLQISIDTVKELSEERKRRREQVRVGRYSFRALNVVLRKERPIDEYFKIVEYIDRCTPVRSQQPLEWARNKRDSLLLHFLMVLPLRRKNCARLLLQAQAGEPPTFGELEAKEMGIIYRYDDEWRVRIPKEEFKNKASPATDNVDVALLDWAGLYERIDSYLEAREILLAGGQDHEQFFVKDLTQPGSNPAEILSPEVLSNIFINTIMKYGVYNPYTKTGAIEDLRAHRIHAIRHLVATHLAKVSDYDTAAARLLDTVKMIRNSYADYRAGEKFADADVGYEVDPREPKPEDAKKVRKKGRPTRLE